MPNDSILEYDHSSLIKQLKICDLWARYSSNSFQTSKTVGSIPILGLITKQAFKTFWLLPILLPARSHWYRIISQKLLIGTYLEKIDTVSSPICRLCQNSNDTLDHFLVDCEKKNYIWKMILMTHYPTTEFTNDQIKQALYYLRTPFPRYSNQVQPFLVLISITQYFIWCSYWKMVLNDELFHPENIIKQINRQIPILLNGIMELD